MHNRYSLNRKLLRLVSVLSVILLITSLLAPSTLYVQNSKATVQNDDHEDYGYLQFAADAVNQAYAAKQNTTVNTTSHIPAIAMGPQIPAT
jgi:hypothetical protein